MFALILSNSFFLSSAACVWQVSKNKQAWPQQMASRSVHWSKWRMLCMLSWWHLTLANASKNSDWYMITRSQPWSYLQWHVLIGEDKQQGMKDSWNGKRRKWETVSISKWLHWVSVLLHFVRCQSVLAYRSDYSAIPLYKLKWFWQAFKSPVCSGWAGAASK